MTLHVTGVTQHQHKPPIDQQPTPRTTSRRLVTANATTTTMTTTTATTTKIRVGLEIDENGPK